MNEFFGVSKGDYFDAHEFNPNAIYDNTDNIASKMIATANDLLEDTTIGSQYSHDGEALACRELIVSERHFSGKSNFEHEQPYGSRPVEHHAILRYGRNIEYGDILEEYDITTAVSIGGVKHALLQNRYFIEVLGKNSEISEAHVTFPDVATGRLRRRMLVPYDVEQVTRFLEEMKKSHK